jgi:hypothetical protein
MPITNESGEVALVYKNPVPHLVDGKHAFAVQHNVSLAWVPAAQAAALVRRRDCAGCGGRVLYSFATQGQVNMWKYGHPRPEELQGCCP